MIARELHACHSFCLRVDPECREFVVIHGVTRGLRLRRGQSVLCLFNDAYDARGVAVGTGTASPAVDRAPLGGRS